MVNSNGNLSRAAIVPRLVELHSVLRHHLPLAFWQRWMNLDLTMPQFKLLLLISAINGARVGDLANRLGVTPPTVTTILDRLVDHGLVRREDDPVDRRLVIARLTVSGQELLQSLDLHNDGDLAECMRGLADEDLLCLLQGMEALHRAWEERHAARDDVRG